MLERIREGSQSMIVKVILVLVIITFALTGVSGYLGSSSEPVVATVDGEEITRTEFDRAYDSERSRLQNELGDMFDVLASEQGYMSQLRRTVIEQLVEARLLQNYAAEQGLRASDEQVRTAIREISAFQTAGQFNNDAYRFALQNAGFTPETFAETMREDLARGQLLEAITGSEFSLSTEAQVLERLINQQRSGRYLQVNVSDYLASVDVTDEQVQTFYADNQSQFATPEQVKVEYVMLSRNDVADGIDIPEQQVREYYDNNLQRYQTDEERRISHILIEFGDDEGAAREQIEQVQTELNTGTEFTELAKQYSDDTFSGEQGGDLEWIQQGDMDADFDEAAFALNDVGDVSDIVETSFGYHLIKLTDLRAGSTRPFEEVAEEIEAGLREQAVDEAYYLAQQDLAEISFEDPESLTAAAEAIASDVETTDWFSREAAPETLAAGQVLNVIFAEESIEQSYNSDPIEVEDSTLVVRVVEHEAAGTQDLTEVREQIVETLERQQAFDLARTEAEQWRNDLLAGEADASMMVEFNGATRQDNQLPNALRSEVFDIVAPAEGERQADLVEDNDSLYIVEITEVAASEASEELRQDLQRQLSNNHQQRLYRAFIDSLRAQANVEIDSDNAQD